MAPLMAPGTAPPSSMTRSRRWSPWATSRCTRAGRWTRRPLAAAVRNASWKRSSARRSPYWPVRARRQVKDSAQVAEADAAEATRLAAANLSPEDRALDLSLRPRALGEFVGQERTRKILGMSIEAARQRGEVLDHVLFSGPPGLGKTSLAHIIARERGVSMRSTSGPAIERAGDLAAIVSGLDEGDVLFIDEIHRLAR